MTLYTIQNERLTVKISDLGAELRSIKDRSGYEYLWQGNIDGLWEGHAPILFPICGQVWEGRYTWQGKTYELGCHGFAQFMTFDGEQISDDCLRMTLVANEETKRLYPFDFSLSVCFRLEDNRLSCTVTVGNRGEGPMPFSLGFHPGFNVPMDGTAFEDWHLSFSEPCAPKEIVVTESGFITGECIPRPLVDGRILPLTHSLFDINSPFYKEIPSSVRLESEKSPRAVTLSYEGLPYLGIWQDEKTEAPFLCIEPWHGMPTIEGRDEELATKTDTVTLQSGETKTFGFICTIE